VYGQFFHSFWAVSFDSNMVHFRVAGCLWLLAGVSLLVASLGRDLSVLRDGEIDRWVLGHLTVTITLCVVGAGLFRATKWARVVSGILLLPAVLVCLDMFLMLGVTRSGRAYLLACSPFILVLVVLAYTLIVIIAGPSGPEESV